MASEDLLTQVANVQAAGTSPAEIQATALSCHAHMLEIAESDKPSAVRYALAGANLLSNLASLRGVLPDWLVIHEEQCCRHGAIWIHHLVLRAPGDPVMGETGLKLLARLLAKRQLELNSPDPEEPKAAPDA